MVHRRSTSSDRALGGGICSRKESGSEDGGVGSPFRVVDGVMVAGYVDDDRLKGQEANGIG